MIKGISVVYLHSVQGSRLADWYEKTLGLSIGSTFPGWTEFDLPSGSRFAIDHVGAPGSDVERQTIMISFEVADIHKAVKALAKRGVRFHPSRDDAVFDVGPSLVATFKDPDGNWMQLNEIKATK